MTGKRENIKQLIRQFIAAQDGSDLAIDGLITGILQVVKYHKRSLWQNSYYHGVIVRILADHFGYSPEEMHEALKFKFLRIERPGKPTTVRSTADENFTRADAENYYSQIRTWASREFGIYIPLPRETGYDDHKSDADAQRR
jgi:hypothetical protein